MKNNISDFTNHMNPRISRKYIFLILIMILTFIFIFILLLNPINSTKEQSIPELTKFIRYQYGIIIDAGSSGSRIFLYKWPPHSGLSKYLLNMSPLLDTNGKPIVRKVNPGLSSLSENPEKVGDYIKPLLDLAMNNIPTNYQKQTPLYIMATAGMRLISKESRDSILKQLRKYVSENYQFLFSERHAAVISGKEEGIYGWIATNYLLGRFNHDHKDGVPVIPIKTSNSHYRSSGLHHRKRTVGVIDMGGGSMQIAYEVDSEIYPANNNPQDPISSDIKTINLGCFDEDVDHTYHIYVATYLGFGANVGRDRYERALVDSYVLNRNYTSVPVSLSIDDPCMNPGLSYTSSIRLLNDLELHKNLSQDNISTGRAPVPKEQSSGFYVRSHQGGLNLSPKQLKLLPKVAVTFKGKGSYHLCESRLPALMDKKPCVTNDKSSPTICTMSGRARPTVPEPLSTEFYGFSEFWYTTNDIYGIGGKYNYFKLHSSANDYCKKEWFTVSFDYKMNKRENADFSRLRTQCFKSAWLSTVFHKGLGFPQSFSQLTTVHSINNTEVQWSLGALLYQTRYFPQQSIESTNSPKILLNNNFPATIPHSFSWINIGILMFMSIVLFFALLYIVHFMPASKFSIWCKRKSTFLIDLSNNNNNSHNNSSNKQSYLPLHNTDIEHSNIQLYPRSNNSTFYSRIQSQPNFQSSYYHNENTWS